MKWVTREKARVDRIACPWLIRKFVDQDAEFLYVPKERVLEVAKNGPANGVGQWLVASLVWGIGLSLGGTTGYAINPARDLGPRIAHALLPIPGKGGSNWRYAPIPIAGDLAGAALAGLLLRYAHL